MGASEKENKPEVHYWHVWTDENGISRQTRAALTSFEKESMGGDADQQWNNHLLCGDAEVLFTTLPVGWKGSWHENPKPQWIIPLSGKWFVETMDGQRVEMGPGDVSFGGDQGTKEDQEGKKGHLSGTVGKTPAVLMIVQLKEEKWIGARPGDFV
ncbi:MAG: cupin domain-containing protein [Bacteroidota bacterium]|nr:cupin domain-containing protein [Bacteroidota bacterium]